MRATLLHAMYAVRPLQLVGGDPADRTIGSPVLVAEQDQSASTDARPSNMSSLTGLPPAADSTVTASHQRALSSAVSTVVDADVAGAEDSDTVEITGLGPLPKLTVIKPRGSSGAPSGAVPPLQIQVTRDPAIGAHALTAEPRDKTSIGGGSTLDPPALIRRSTDPVTSSSPSSRGVPHVQSQDFPRSTSGALSQMSQPISPRSPRHSRRFGSRPSVMAISNYDRAMPQALQSYRQVSAELRVCRRSGCGTLFVAYDELNNPGVC